jgi:hypothetical protein
MKSQLVATIAAVVLVGCVGVSKTELLKDEEGNLIITMQLRWGTTKPLNNI